MANKTLAALENQSAKCIRVVIDADATGGKAVPIPFPCVVKDVTVVCTASNGGGTLILSNGTAITDAIVCATDTAVTRAGTIDDAYYTLYPTSSVTVTANGADDRGIVNIIVREI
jgi:hypothetical protein